MVYIKDTQTESTDKRLHYFDSLVSKFEEILESDFVFVAKFGEEPSKKGEESSHITHDQGQYEEYPIEEFCFRDMASVGD